MSLVVILFSISLLAEAGALALIVREAREAQITLRAWLDLNPNGYSSGTYDQMKTLNPVVQSLLGRPSSRYLAAGLIALGLTTGSAANFLSL